MFAVELMMPEVSVRTFLPVALATGTATFIGRLYFGLEPAFRMPVLANLPHHATSLGALLLFALLGILTGLAATAFIKGLHWVEGIFDRVRNPYFRHASGMLWPASSPVNASSRTSRCVTHDSGSVWLAIPLLLRTFTFYSFRSLPAH